MKFLKKSKSFFKKIIALKQAKVDRLQKMYKKKEKTFELKCE